MKRLVVAVALGASLVSTQAFAQAQTPPAQTPPAQTPQEPQAQGPHGGWMRNMTRDEAKQRADMMFQRFDLNHDGVVTRQEVDQLLAQMSSGANPDRVQRMNRMVDRIFGNAQSITKAQFEAEMLARYDRMHANRGAAPAPAQ